MSPSLPPALHRRDFRLLLAARVLGAMALQSQAVIIGWQIYSLTRDPFFLGLAGLAEAVPALACALVAGHIVDASRPHRVFLIAVGAVTLNMLGLLVVGGGFIPVGAHLMLAWLFAGSFFSGIARSFLMPTSFALLQQVVPRSQLSAASAWLTGSFHVAGICGPAAVGLIYGLCGAGIAWLMPASLISIEWVLLFFMTGPTRAYRSAHRREPAVKSIKAGWSFIWHKPVLLPVMALDMFAVLFGGAIAMLPAYADQVLHVGTEGLGLLRAASGAGAAVIALSLGLRPLGVMRGTTLLLVVAGFGLSIIGFGSSTSFWLSFFFLAAGGAFDGVSMIIRSTLMQLLTPDEMRGRVSAVGSMFIISSNEIGAFESGLMARFLGLVPSVIAGGFATLAIVAMTAIVSPALRKIAVEMDKKE